MRNRISALSFKELKITEEYLRDVKQIGKERHRNEILILIFAALCSIISLIFLAYLVNKVFILGIIYMGITIYFDYIKDCVWEKLSFLVDRNSLTKFDEITHPYTEYLKENHSKELVEEANRIFDYALDCGIYFPKSMREFYTRDRRAIEKRIPDKPYDSCDEGYDALCRLVGGIGYHLSDTPTFFERTHNRPSYEPSYNVAEERERIERTLQAVDYHYNMATTQKHLKNR